MNRFLAKAQTERASQELRPVFLRALSSSNRTIASVSEELGISRDVIQRWSGGGDTLPAKHHGKIAQFVKVHSC